jgi:hypothetical protein
MGKKQKKNQLEATLDAEENATPERELTKRE